MKNIIFIAPPAAGKGTQSDLLVNKHGYIHISTGDLLRNEVNENTELGKQLTEIMSSGEFVSDEIVTELLRKCLTNIDSSKNFILDGYPRNINQAEKLDELLQTLEKSIDVVIYLDMDEETAMKRVLGRIVCESCAHGYNKYEIDLKPIKEGICDSCGGTLVSREDDNEETFKVRFQAFLDETKPILEYYKEKGILNIIKSDGSLEETNALIESVIK